MVQHRERRSETQYQAKTKTLSLIQQTVSNLDKQLVARHFSSNYVL